MRSGFERWVAQVRVAMIGAGVSMMLLSEAKLKKLYEAGTAPKDVPQLVLDDKV